MSLKNKDKRERFKYMAQTNKRAKENHKHYFQQNKNQIAILNLTRHTTHVLSPKE
jgi:hypothetical protein